MQPNVLLGIPSGGSVKTKTMFSIISVMVQSTCQLTIVERSGALGPDNRNHLAQMALDGGRVTMVQKFAQDMSGTRTAVSIVKLFRAISRAIGSR